MIDGWYSRIEVRKEGASAGTFDTYFFAPEGRRFRSRAEVARFFGLEPAPRYGNKGCAAPSRTVAPASDTVEYERRHRIPSGRGTRLRNLDDSASAPCDAARLRMQSGMRLGT